MRLLLGSISFEVVQCRTQSQGFLALIEERPSLSLPNFGSVPLVMFILLLKIHAKSNCIKVI